MERIENSELKAILHSKRANLYYLSECRVMQKGGRIVYLTEASKENRYYNIPVANTTVLLLGMGTSITQAAVRVLAGAGVLLGFCGGGGTPLFAGAEIEWLTPQSEYRPTEYVQGWLAFWFDEGKRLAAAKRFQLSRCRFLETVWTKDEELGDAGFYADDMEITRALSGYRNAIDGAENVTELLTSEAQFTKQLYKYAAQRCGLSRFVRVRSGEKTETDLAGTERRANDFLDHGNYLAYGLGATTLWVLGIPHGFAVMHGKTRRGALVFDVADLIKDAIVLPWAFISAERSMTEQEFRQFLLQKFTEHKALDFLFNEVKETSREAW